ncbi:MAG: AI-2E family transporter [Verrucomicrobia bacterium]|nr:AI-2E family transporter [Verrucomicrobiota bacterium]
MGFPLPTEKQGRILWVSITALAVGVLLALMGLLVLGLGWVINQLSVVLLPLAVAGVIAYLLDPVVDYFVSLKIPRVRAVLLVFFLVIMLVIGLLATVVPRVIVETNSLVKSLPGHVEDMQKKFEEWMVSTPLGIELPSWWPWSGSSTNAPGVKESVEVPSTAGGDSTNAVLVADSESAGATNEVGAASADGARSARINRDLGESLISWMPRALQSLPVVGKWLVSQLSAMASWVGLIIGFSLIPVYLFYFLLEKRGIQRSWTDYLPIHESRTKEELVFVLKSINDYLILFFRGQVLVALCDGVLYTIGFLLIGLPYAFLIGLAAGFLSIVPYLGFVISLVPALVLAIIQYGDWLHPVLTLVVFGVVQSLEGLFISPKIMGDRVGLHPLTIIVAVMLGTALMGGILGGILAIPLTAALRVLMFRYVWRKRGEVA